MLYVRLKDNKAICTNSISMEGACPIEGGLGLWQSSGVCVRTTVHHSIAIVQQCINQGRYFAICNDSVNYHSRTQKVWTEWTFPQDEQEYQKSGWSSYLSLRGHKLIRNVYYLKNRQQQLPIGNRPMGAWKDATGQRCNLPEGMPIAIVCKNSVFETAMLPREVRTLSSHNRSELSQPHTLVNRDSVVLLARWPSLRWWLRSHHSHCIFDRISINCKCTDRSCQENGSLQ